MSSKVKNKKPGAVQKKGLQPKLRFSEFRNAGDWEKLRLKDISSAIFDGTHQTPTYTSDGVPFYSVENIVSGNKNKFISYDDYLIATSKNKPEKGDVLITRIGKIGFSQVVTWNHEFSIYVTLAVIKRSNYFNSFYLHHFMQSEFYQTEIMKKSLLNAVPCKINMDSLRNTEILLPKLKEQQKIADCLSSLDELIDAEGKKLEALQQHKKGLMQELFPAEGETLPRRRFPEFKKASEWEEKTLKDLCAMQAGKFIPAAEIYDIAQDGLYPCFGGNGLRGYVKSYTHKGKYPLIGRQGALCGNVNLAINSFYATEHAVVVTAKAKINVDWLYYQLIRLNLNQYATGQAQPGLSVDVLEKIVSVTPAEPKEQRRIADLLSSVDDLIVAQNQKLAALRDHKTGLIQQLFPTASEVLE